jgi:hypothetical protein
MGASHFSGPVVSAAGFVGSGISNNEDPTAAGGFSTLVARRPGITDAAPVTVMNINVPNADHNAVLFLELMAHPSGAGANASDSTRVALGAIAIARKTNLAAVAVVAALALAQIATSGTATIALAYAVSAAVGANNASQTISLSVTITQTGGAIVSHTLMVSARLMNSNANGITVAAV